ncbi:MAG TPA: GNAT family N-acetyltransferase [Allosphingosinicella sp.]|nr:GNAT family N-acetyltransferase [Allosphingosinicella sp.]
MISYRDAAPADAAVLADLHRRSFVETFGHLYRREDLEAFLAGLNEDGFRGELLDGEHRVRFAEADGVPVAFVKLGPVSLPVQPVRRALEFRQLYVLKPWQGAGIAAALTDWALALARARGAEELYLSVWANNDRAKAFYRRYGFAYVGPYKFMVGAQADEDEIWKLDL